MAAKSVALRLLLCDDKPGRFFTVIKFWTDETSRVALALTTGVPCYKIEDEEGGIHLLIHVSGIDACCNETTRLGG